MDSKGGGRIFKEEREVWEIGNRIQRRIAGFRLDRDDTRPATAVGKINIECVVVVLLGEKGHCLLGNPIAADRYLGEVGLIEGIARSVKGRDADFEGVEFLVGKGVDLEEALLSYPLRQNLAVLSLTAVDTSIARNCAKGAAPTRIIELELLYFGWYRVGGAKAIHGYGSAQDDRTTGINR